MGHWNSRAGATGWVGGAAVLFTAVALLAGCSGTAHTAAANTTTKPAAPSRSTSPSPAASTATSTAQLSSDQSGIQKAVATWVAAIIEGNPAQLCSVTGQLATATSPAQASSPQLCAGGGPQEVVTAWRPRFTPEHLVGHPTVRVSQVPVFGNVASVPAREVDVNGQSLHAIMVSHGLQANATDDTIYTTKINGSWLVTGFLVPQG